MSNPPESETKPPQKSFLQTLGKHLVTGSDKLPAIEPKPPKAEDKPAEPAEAAKPAEGTPVTPAVAAAAPAEATKPDEAKPEAKSETPPEKKVKIAPKKSEPLPPIPADDIAAAPTPVIDEPKPLAERLGHQPSRAEARYVEVLEAAAVREPARYQAVLDREVDRLKKVHAFEATWKEEHPDESLIDEDTGKPVPEYRKFLNANRPSIDADEHEDLRETFIADRAKQSARAEMEETLRPKLRKVAELESKPVIEKAEKDLEAAVLAALPADDYLAKVAKDGLDAVAKVPVEGPVIAVAVQRGREVVRDFLALRRELVDFDVRNPTHVFISRSIATAATIFAEKGGEDRLRKGTDGTMQRFVPPVVYRTLKPEARAKHWTFSDDEIVSLFTAMASEGLRQELTAKRQEMEEHQKFRTATKPAGKEKSAPAVAPTASSPALEPSPVAPSASPSPVKNKKLKSMLGVA
jgi:hypothetical protein